MSDDFNRDVLRDPVFRSNLTCLAIDELHLVEDWKDFREKYGCIQYLRQRLPAGVPLLGVSATRLPSVLGRIRLSAGFRQDTNNTPNSGYRCCNRIEFARVSKALSSPVFLILEVIPGNDDCTEGGKAAYLSFSLFLEQFLSFHEPRV
jgi:hypothetical protein